MTSDSANGVVVTRNVWKIFGERADEAMAACRRENLSKAEVLDRFEAVVGVRDVSVSVEEGEIFCILQSQAMRARNGHDLAPERG